MSSAAQAFEQRSAAAVAQVVANLDNGTSVSDVVAPSSSPPVAGAAGRLDFRAAQIEKDAKLAEDLQREEYRQEEVRVERHRQRRAAAAAEQNASWADWFMGTAPSTSPISSTTGAASNSTGPQSSASSAAGGGARVAQPSGSIFACVAQSIGSVMTPPHTQVRGVDSSSLL
uniref:Uncharacterized protein n=1 Tax=Pseudo-nitzschia australis TaxID=44445 RepID=A0A7S4AQN8_9STRA|mmetsp:Transcript_25571/g.56024  ORF Transcript_25571/g.56024 Transcript_25571/m.56024 type:complete len:172 (-) Transcript_25571:143-658(-)|eukprot:CAMPEP_0168194724 /NCGR_PEP_ID=MMETSP0139_2-20121125/19408_1 /TAXON_ID=44445 /ORGANISM="Pseudo-nitzschia australis, Strain 10249 10 AB" /LENGTH=171 /DNA_ID=CAMNT_0008118397 /DNA_START=165 /DNA_END=680 /DNA_ORIENTATION=+